MQLYWNGAVLVDGSIGMAAFGFRTTELAIFSDDTFVLLWQYLLVAQLGRRLGFKQ